VNKIPPAPSPTDSLNVLYIYLGGNNFAFIEGGESLRYESRIEGDYYPYGWFSRIFSMMDINGDGYSDLLTSHYYKDSTLHVHYGSINVLDTIPSYYLTDPDTTREDIIIGKTCHDVGDWNNDGYDDFLLKSAGFKTFSVHLGGPYLNNMNPYGLKGLLESVSTTFPTKAISCEDQNGDNIKDFVVTANSYGPLSTGYVIIYKGRDDIVVSVDEKEAGKLPSQFRLEQNFPNPFNSSTVIGYLLSVIGKVKITVYDALGNEITILKNEEQTPGEYEIEFDAEKYQLSSGIYFYKLKTEGGEITKKMILLK